ncbi:MAG: phosphodiesterase [Pseudomonadota bacterium]
MLIAHLTDLHIMPEGARVLDRVDPSERLRAAIDAVNALGRQPDLVVITGDVTEDGTQEEYARALDLLTGLKAPYVAINGNHDVRQGFFEAFAPLGFLGQARDFVQFTVDRFPVRIIGLDSTVHGAHHAAFCPDRVGWLGARLDEQPEKPTLLLLHHPPVRTGIDWMDIPDRDWHAGFGDVLKGRTNVLAVLSGHMHRAIMGTAGGVPVHVAASVSHQLALDLDPAALPKLAFEPPAYMLHVFEDGALASHHVLVERYEEVAVFTDDPALWARTKDEVVARGTLPKQNAAA